jgi:predicted nucleic acid-binding protein
MYTMDASVWVNGFDQREPGHEISRQFLGLVSVRLLPIVVPNLMLVEVAGVISRTRGDAAHALGFVAALRGLPNLTFVALDDSLSQQAQLLAAQRGLRGADAVYAAVANVAGCTLVTLDQEQVARLSGSDRPYPGGRARTTGASFVTEVPVG